MWNNMDVFFSEEFLKETDNTIPNFELGCLLQRLWHSADEPFKYIILDYYSDVVVPPYGLYRTFRDLDANLIIYLDGSQLEREGLAIGDDDDDGNDNNDDDDDEDDDDDI